MIMNSSLQSHCKNRQDDRSIHFILRLIVLRPPARAGVYIVQASRQLPRMTLPRDSPVPSPEYQAEEAATLHDLENSISSGSCPPRPPQLQGPHPPLRSISQCEPSFFPPRPSILEPSIGSGVLAEELESAPDSDSCSLQQLRIPLLLRNSFLEDLESPAE